MSDPTELDSSCPPYFEETEQICPEEEGWSLRDIFERLLALFGVKEVVDDED